MVILRDTREKPGKGWYFSGHKLKTKCLKTGDYSIEGLENKIVIERKENAKEIASSIVKDRFQREVERMAHFPFSFILIECSLSDINLYPRGAGLPIRIRKRIRVRGEYIKKKLKQYLLKYNIQTILCGDKLRAEEMAFFLLQYHYHKYVN